MKTKHANIIWKNKDIASVFVLIAAVLAIPLVGMQFSDEWDWSLFDFILIGSLIIGTGFLIVQAYRRIKNIYYRIAVIIAIIAALLLIWGELAVGLFGTPFSGS